MKNTGNLAESVPTPAQKQILFHHDPSNTDGWITLAQKDPHTKRFRQYHYQPEELADCLASWTGEDIYYSQNTFYKPIRRIDKIRQLRSLYVDIDVYNKGLNPEWVLGKLELEFFGKTIPEPNMVIYSGRGLVLIWNIVPVPHMAMPLWRAVENRFAEELNPLGSDPKATDPTRVFRLAGTINSKNGAVVTAQYRHDYRYDIHELQYDYLPELTPPSPASKKKPGRKKKVVRLFNIYTLHLARARDVAKLVELREGHVTGHREFICFLFRYFTCCHTNDPQQALAETLDLNSEFSSPLPEHEVRRATMSAQKAWEAKSDAKADAAAKAMGYPGAGYRLKNAKIIEWLEITPEEQREMSTIIGPREKRRRDLSAKAQKRREEGARTMEEYNLDRKRKAESKADILRRIMSDNPEWSNVRLGKELGVSEGYVRKLRKTL